MPKKSAFYYFMIEFKKRENGKGLKFPNMVAVAHHAGKEWEKMDGVQREPYVQQAQAANGISNSGGGGPLNSLGIPMSLIDEKLHEKEAMTERKKHLIAERVKRSEAVKALEKEEFYIISMTYFGCTLKGVYLPAELGMVKYSLQDGVKDRKHLYINPGEIPLGAAYSVHCHTEKTHKLPIPSNAWGTSSNDEVSEVLLSFLAAKDNILQLYTDENSLPSVESMLRGILKGHIKDEQLYVCPLPELFFNLKQAAELRFMTKSTFPSALTAQYILQMDCFVFTKGISCDYHEGEYNLQHCALSQATRWAYTISKYCCLEMGIDCIPGKHIPGCSSTDAKSAILPNPGEKSLNQAEEPSSSTNPSRDPKLVAKQKKLEDICIDAKLEFVKCVTTLMNNVQEVLSNATAKTDSYFMVSPEKYNRSFAQILEDTRKQIERICNSAETQSTSARAQWVWLNPSTRYDHEKKLRDICTDAKSELLKCVITLMNNVQEVVLPNDAPSDKP
ncbi:protein maelstrom homolog [Anopheles moucheti]|uniref:protein maelstrom homolog n=1 Tax=Anopheles moucheti TaxID=186751 RepID=UPI0022F109CD|nr:protein maelstrom homolog [Anopheles moucheti]